MTQQNRGERAVNASRAVVVRDRRIDGRDAMVRVREYRVAEESSRTPFLWIHGGGFSSGGLDQKESDAPARVLAAAGVRVITVEYRLAPPASLFRDPRLGSHPGRYPAGLNDVVDVATSLINDGGRVNIGGASAGADLAAAATLRLRDVGVSLPQSLVLAYGTFHAVLPPSERIESELRGPLARWAFNPTMVRRMNLNYVGDPEKLVPGYAFPGGADLGEFPPTLVLNATNDRLRRSGHAFATELRSAGSELREVDIAGGHAFLNRPKSDAFREGLGELTTWLQEHD